ncbi:MAG: hypothetical protein PHQ04_12065 [Opitutaceae bacterium]|nr:hypothetical protein [Opitutaceae bacterium]
MSEKPREPKVPSLTDYLLRYDLTAMIEEARLDYSQAASGEARHLTQKDIAARFRKQHQARKAPNE